MMVVDSSLILAHMLRERTATVAEGALVRASELGAAAPALLPFEVANVLGRKLRRGELLAAQRDALLRQWPKYLVAVEGAPDPDKLVSIAALAQQHQLTAYDAAYLELALRLNAELGTLDRPLAEAARASGLVAHSA